MIVITVNVVFPFVMMSILSVHAKRITYKKFAAKYGTIVEGIDISRHDTYKAYYYAVFSSQRFISAVILVMLFPYPAIQCFSLIGLQVLMMLYIGCL